MPPCLSFPTLCPPFPWGQLGPGQLAATVTHARLARGPAAIPVPVPSGAMGASSCPPPASCWHRSSFPPPFAFFRGFLGFFFQEKPQTRAERIKGLAGAQGTGRGELGGSRAGSPPAHSAQNWGVLGDTWPRRVPGAATWAVGCGRGETEAWGCAHTCSHAHVCDVPGSGDMAVGDTRVQGEAGRGTSPIGLPKSGLGGP